MERHLAESEALAMRELTADEIQAQRTELQKSRVLMSFYEQKCKRLKKIKSKKSVEKGP